MEVGENTSFDGQQTQQIDNQQDIKLSTGSEFLDKLKTKGNLPLEELWGQDWEKRAVTNSPLDIADRLGYGQATGIATYDRERDGLNETAQELLVFLQSSGRLIDVVKLRGEDGTEKRLIQTSKVIPNVEGRAAFWYHELIDPDAPTNTVIKHDDGRVLFGFEAERTFVSNVYNEGGKVKTPYLDLQALGSGEKKASEPLFIGLTKDGNFHKSRGFDYAAHRDGDITGMQVITDFNDFTTYMHEHGHLSYGDAIPEWDEQMLEARRIFNGRDSASGMPSETARGLISFNENAAWGVARDTLSWMQTHGYDIGVLDKVISLAEEEQGALLTYDMAPHEGNDPHPEAFSNLMKELRKRAMEAGANSRFDQDTGERISHCPLLQLAQEGADIKSLLKETGMVSETALKGL